MMKMKKLILLIALILGCTLESYAQKSTFQFRDAQSRAGDAVSEVCVKPVVAEVRLLGGETPKRQVFTYKFTREEVEIGLKGDLGNVLHGLLIKPTKMPVATLSWQPPIKWKLTMKEATQ